MRLWEGECPCSKSHTQLTVISRDQNPFFPLKTGKNKKRKRGKSVLDHCPQQRSVVNNYHVRKTRRNIRGFLTLPPSNAGRPEQRKECKK